MAENGGGFHFFKGFLFGGLFGAIAGLLFAPKSGKETREDIRRYSVTLKNNSIEKLEEVQRKAEEILEETKRQLHELKGNAESAAKDLAETAGSHIKEGKDAVAQEKGRVKEAIAAGVTAYKEEKSKKSEG